MDCRIICEWSCNGEVVNGADRELGGRIAIIW